MIAPRRLAVVILAIFHVIMVTLLVHLTFFAADMALSARIDELHNLLAERAE